MWVISRFTLFLGCFIYSCGVIDTINQWHGSLVECLTIYLFYGELEIGFQYLLKELENV
jgi:hypothetical protein